MSKKILSIFVLVLTFSFTTQAFASLTFTSNAITGTTASSIDLGAGNTLSLNTTNNAPITTGTGLVTLGGGLKVAGLTSGRVPFASTGGLLVDDSNLVYYSGSQLLSTERLILTGTTEANGANPPLSIETSFLSGSGTVSAAKITASNNFDDVQSKSVLKLTGNYDGSVGSFGTSYGLYSSIQGDSVDPITDFSSPEYASIGVFSLVADSGQFGGDMIGIFGRGTTGLNRNIGVMAYGRSGVLSIGGAFYASNGTNKIGVIGTLNSAIPTATSAAILADNGSIAAPIFLGRDNGVTKFSIKDGGTVNITVATYADNAAALTGGLVAGDVYRTSTGVLMIVY